MTAHRQSDAAILRQAALRDVEPGHDLDARNHRSLQLSWWCFNLVQYAVVAVAQAQPILERLDVNVRRAGLYRARDQLID